jgi:alpha-D-ribose 1-methylphosphonate 5-triphosphate diphosphatase
VSIDSFSITNVRAVLADRLLDDATVVVEEGLIAGVADGRTAATPVSYDGSGAFLLPGVIDTHSDGVEREIWPRPAAPFPVDFALRVFEGRLQAAGVTTVFHGVGFQEKQSYQRTVAQAVELCEEVGKRRATAEVPCDHRILYRLEAREEHGWEECFAQLPDQFEGEPLPLVSFEDHSPGQGQFRDLEKLKRAGGFGGATGEELDRLVDSAVAESAARSGLRDTHIGDVSRLAGDGRVRLLAHDLEDAEQVAAAADWGAAVAEFPLTGDAAAEARRRELPVVLGAPNVLRGGSHSGNVSAEELIATGLCTSLASDYQPATLLAAVFALAERGSCSLPDAVALVTGGAATVAGLQDRGSLRVGARADLALVALDGAWPTVRHVWRA